MEVGWPDCRNPIFAERRDLPRIRPSSYTTPSTLVRTSFEYPIVPQSRLSCTNLSLEWLKRMFPLRFGQETCFGCRFSSYKRGLYKATHHIRFRCALAQCARIIPSTPDDLYAPPAKPSFSSCLTEERTENHIRVRLPCTLKQRTDTDDCR